MNCCHFHFKKNFIVIASIFFLFFLSSFAYAQNSSQKNNGNASSGISMPSMPTVSMPSIGSGFYSPGRNDFYNGARNQNQSKNSVSKSSTSTQQNLQTNTLTNDSSETSNLNQNALKNAENLNSLANKASSTLNKLSADDISSLNNLGLFSQVSGLLGRSINLPESAPSNQNAVTANTADSATLQKILSELTELKNQVNAENEKVKQDTDISGNVPKNQNISLSDKSQASETFSNKIKKEPKILRFIVNGYDLLSTCKKIYFSETETDGTFLLTGDRKYMSENKARSETFYFYFRANGMENGITKYAVTPAVSQDYENEYSYLYQLTQKSELVANRTGNLVTLRANDGDWKMDLLISLDRN